MPLTDEFVEAAGAAKHSRALDEIARLLWRAHGEGHIADADAEAVSEAIAGRRRVFAAGKGFTRPPSPRAVLSHPRGSPRSPDRTAIALATLLMLPSGAFAGSYADKMREQERLEDCHKYAAAIYGIAMMSHSYHHKI